MVPAPRGAGIDDVFTSSRGSTKTSSRGSTKTLETRFQKSPYQEYTDLLATKLDSAAKAVTELWFQTEQ
ncbi:unnamed protein product [Brassica napus]|uniref:(rape) hypothetical protein n=1 Tax=Brassica napus TaxID=3708 RepID=A0A816NWU1_BRANA|nr:unnamed protein product [Brassica napus]